MQTPIVELTGIKADLLIPGRGEPLKNAALVFSHSQIEWVGSQNDIPQKYDSVTFHVVQTVMPGLWDCHIHFFGTQSASLKAIYELPSAALAGARLSRDVEATLLAGFTSVRELGGYGADISLAITEGTIIGPNIYSSVTPISMTAGHGDLHSVPMNAMLDACSHGIPLAICDGVDECVKTVRLMLRRGAKVIKVCATGGVTSELDDPKNRQFSDAELRAIVDEAGRASRLVAAHCHGKEGILAALRAGCKTIEHGSYLDEEVIDEMKKSDAILVATRTIAEAALTLEDAFDPISWKKVVKVSGAGRKAYRLAIEKGVTIALGTDLGLSVANSPLSHGNNGIELKWAVECGMTPLEAVEAATVTAPRTLGLQAPLSGQLKQGYDADIIALDLNPLDDIKVLSHPENIRYVWKGGKLFKHPHSLPA